jgi:hypothetical protein
MLSGNYDDMPNLRIVVVLQLPDFCAVASGLGPVEGHATI